MVAIITSVFKGKVLYNLQKMAIFILYDAGISQKSNYSIRFAIDLSWRRTKLLLIELAVANSNEFLF